jgi:hypothetical protein
MSEKLPRSKGENKMKSGRRDHRKASRVRAPRSLEEALTQGWTIHEDLAGWQFRGGNRREGFILLRRKGTAETLIVRSTALYELGRPHFLGA